MGPPAVNTALLLSSGVTVTFAHWALIRNDRPKLLLWLGLTILLGVTFLGVQAYEYGHAYSDLNLKLSTGVYGSTFFMLTGFHGFHVTIGAIMLTVIWFRCLKGHFVRPPLRVRGRGVVLALRGRGVAGPLYPRCLLAIDCPAGSARAHVTGNQEHEQSHRQAYAPGEGARHAPRVAAAAQHEKRRRAQARDEMASSIAITT